MDAPTLVAVAAADVAVEALQIQPLWIVIEASAVVEAAEHSPLQKNWELEQKKPEKRPKLLAYA